VSVSPDRDSVDPSWWASFALADGLRSIPEQAFLRFEAAPKAANDDAK